MTNAFFSGKSNKEHVPIHVQAMEEISALGNRPRLLTARWNTQVILPVLVYLTVRSLEITFLQFI